MRKPYLILLISALAFGQPLFAQQKKVQFSGQFGLYGDFYKMYSDTIGAVAGRRPGSVGRMVLNTSLSYGDFSLPVSFMFSAGQASVILPPFPRRNFLEYIRDPSNRVGIAPKYKWIQLQLGTQVPQYSELSVGDLPQFGAGIDLTPGKFRFSCFAGTTQLAIEEDSARNIPGIYARKMYSGKIGFGKEEATHLYFVTALMKDDTSSLRRKPEIALPQNGVVSSLDYRIMMGKKFYIKGEVAASAFTRDNRTALMVSDTPLDKILSSIFTLQESSRFDYASALTLAKEGKIFGIKLTGKYIGDGFVPLGYPFMQTDRIDITINPRFNLFKSKVQLSGLVGKRINNLSGARAATTTQTLANADLNAQLTERLSFSGSFSNFDFRNSILEDTLHVQMVTLSWSLSPTYTYMGSKNMHVVTILYAQNTFTDFNTITGALNGNNSQNTMASYILTNLKNPFDVSLVGSYFNNQMFLGILTTSSVNISLGYKFLEKKLGTTFGLTYTDNQLDSNPAGTQVVLDLGLKYNATKKLALSVNGSLNLFQYGTDRPGIYYRENLLRTSILYKF